MEYTFGDNGDIAALNVQFKASVVSRNMATVKLVGLAIKFFPKKKTSCLVMARLLKMAFEFDHKY